MGHSRESATTESKVIAGEQIDWRDYRLTGLLCWLQRKKTPVLFEITKSEEKNIYLKE